jgi:hypothetical protein
MTTFNATEFLADIARGDKREYIPTLWRKLSELENAKRAVDEAVRAMNSADKAGIGRPFETLVEPQLQMLREQIGILSLAENAWFDDHPEHADNIGWRMRIVDGYRVPNSHDYLERIHNFVAGVHAEAMNAAIDNSVRDWTARSNGSA